MTVNPSAKDANAALVDLPRRKKAARTKKAPVAAEMAESMTALAAKLFTADAAVAAQCRLGYRIKSRRL